MANEIISYLEMCQREGASLQRGMNYHLGKNYSVILMSQRINAPYEDRIENDGTVLIYEGHDVPRNNKHPNPKVVDQMEVTSTGSLTENGKFYRAAQSFVKSGQTPERVRVYEKIHSGIWSYNGLFQLVDAWKKNDGQRLVFKFKLEAIEEDKGSQPSESAQKSFGRLIPTSVKLEVWRRDGGKCTICGATDELHFDHVIPFAKGGTSLRSENIQILCARHNLEKSDQIK